MTTVVHPLRRVVRGNTAPSPHPAPTIRLIAEGSSPLAESTASALQLLVAAGRVQWADASHRADLLHTVGDVDATGGWALAHRVHTVERIPVRQSRRLVASRRWVMRERRRCDRGTVWLAHGRRAASLLVEAGLAPGERVRCLPILAPTGFAATGDVSLVARRQSARRVLGVRPGARLVVGIPGAGPPSAVDGWPAAVARLRRTDVQAIRPAAGGALPLESLLAAADLFVAGDRALAAVSPAVAALATGLPVIATTTDGAAELVDAGCTGVVVAPRLDAIVDAVVAQLDGAPPPLRRDPTTSGPPPRHELARGLLRAYNDVLASPAVRGRRQ